MKKSRKDSVLEVLGSEYINGTRDRFDIDKDAVVIQIEPGNDGDYMVEVVRP